MASKDENQKPIIIKKVKKGGHEGHHGGQWKVAYADFVTAMMAFFLMLWLLNATTEAQRDGIADYFSPTSISKSNSGGGGMLSGRTISKDGALVHRRAPMGVNIKLPPAEKPDSPENVDKKDGETGPATEAERRREEQERFEKAAAKLANAMDAPGLKDLQDNVNVDQTDEGLRIQIVDQLNKPMFASGSSEPLPRTERLLGRVSQAIQGIPNKVAIKGHTDATSFRSRENYSNWELSSDRANASRRVLVRSGLPEDRVAEVTGRADEDLLVPDNPTSPRNRRISILLKYKHKVASTDTARREGANGTITATESVPTEGDENTPQPRSGPSIIDEPEPR